MILSKIKIVKLKVGQLAILNMSFIYDKTSHCKGGMIGTMYHNYNRSVLTLYLLYLSRSPPKILRSSSSGMCMSYTDLCMHSQV